jgi:hypothetical protein
MYGHRRRVYLFGYSSSNYLATLAVYLNEKVHEEEDPYGI